MKTKSCQIIQLQITTSCLQGCVAPNLTLWAIHIFVFSASRVPMCRVGWAEAMFEVFIYGKVLFRVRVQKGLAFQMQRVNM